jgi:hypothetical protein
MPERDWLSMSGGLLLAAVALAGVAYAAYHAWYAGDLTTGWAYGAIGFGFLFFALGAFVFAYGWERGDMEKALRLTFFVCVAALAAIVAIVLLFKSKGGAAKGAAEIGRATGSAARSGGYDAGRIFGALSSMLEDGTKAIDEAEAPAASHDRPFQLTCRGCGARYAPAPPRAQCPFCGEYALTG